MHHPDEGPTCRPHREELQAGGARGGEAGALTRGPQTTIINPEDDSEKDFAFDYSYWSHDGFVTEEDGYNTAGGPASQFGAEYSSQKDVYEHLGVKMLENAWAVSTYKGPATVAGRSCAFGPCLPVEPPNRGRIEICERISSSHDPLTVQGYNCTMFAYGQTGAGKSYSFVGYGSNKGILPLACEEIFKRIKEQESATHKFQVECAMMEIYGRELRDLLNPKSKEKLKIRNGKTGTYVQGLKKSAVGSYKAIEKVQDVGTANRTVGATNMNATSSRAHTIVTITLGQKIQEEGREREFASDIVLVDLAGSERAESTGATGARLQEGIEINVSLSALGNVISALAEKANNPRKKVFVPYRSHVLTELLQSALGGNSKTVMVAAVSPANINYDESLSTLRYADRAKQIKVVVEVMENPTDKLIRELKAENDKLRKMLSGIANGEGVDLSPLDGSGGESGAAADQTSDLKRDYGNTITEEELARKIEEAVANAKAASEEEKAKAIEEMQRMEAERAAAASKSMLGRHDMETILKNAIMQVPGVSEYSKKDAVDEALSELGRLYSLRASGGARMGPEETISMVTETLEMWDSEEAEVPREELEAAISEAKELLAFGAPVWSKGALSYDQLVDVMEQVMKKVESAPEPVRKKAISNVLYDFEGERQAAMGNLLSKPVVVKAVRAAVSLLGIDGVDGEDFKQIEKATKLAEEAFDKVSSEAGSGILTTDNAEAALAKVMEKLSVSAPADVEEAAKQFEKEKQRVEAKAEAAERQKAALAEQLARNSEMLAELTKSWEQKMASSEEDVSEMARELGLDVSREDLQVYPSLRNLNQDALLNGRLIHLLYPGKHTFGLDEADDDFYHTLGGEGIEDSHCDISFDDSATRKLTLGPGEGVCFVNGKKVVLPVELKHNDRLVLGLSQVFHVFDPQVAMLENGGGEKKIIDWEMAHEEVKAGLQDMIDYKAKEQTKHIKNEANFRLQVEKLRRNHAQNSIETLESQLTGAKDEAEATRLIREATERAQKAEEELKIVLGKLGSVTRERDEALKKLDEISALKAQQLKARYKGGSLGGQNPAKQDSPYQARPSTGGARVSTGDGSGACTLM
eukprot:scaffold96392_cov23-Tisochrysis_lutea.AAC.1